MSFYERPLEPIYSKQKSFYNAARIRFFDGGYRVLASYTTEVCCCNPQTGYVDYLDENYTPRARGRGRGKVPNNRDFAGYVAEDYDALEE